MTQAHLHIVVNTDRTKCMLFQFWFWAAHGTNNTIGTVVFTEIVRVLRSLLWYKCHRLFYSCLHTTLFSLYKFCTQWGSSSLTSLSACNQVIIVWLKQPTCYCRIIDLEIRLLKLPLSCLLNTTLITVLVWTFTCCEGSCIHWTCREHSTSTEPSLVDSETVVSAFLQSIKCVLLIICIQSALVNVGPTVPQ